MSIGSIAVETTFMLSTRDFVHIALFAAIIAVLGLLPKIHLAAGVPITAQSLGVMLAGGVLGARKGGLSMLLFLILVVAGMPLLAGGRGGLGVLAGPSGGFLLAFPVGAVVTGYLVERLWRKLDVAKAILCTIVGGIVALYLIGIPWMIMMTDFGVSEAALLMLPFMPGDLIKAILAAIVIVAIKKSWPLIETPLKA